MHNQLITLKYPHFSIISTWIFRGAKQIDRKCAKLEQRDIFLTFLKIREFPLSAISSYQQQIGNTFVNLKCDKIGQKFNNWYSIYSMALLHNSRIIKQLNGSNHIGHFIQEQWCNFFTRATIVFRSSHNFLPQGRSLYDPIFFRHKLGLYFGSNKSLPFFEPKTFKVIKIQ